MIIAACIVIPHRLSSTHNILGFLEKRDVCEKLDLHSYLKKLLQKNANHQISCFLLQELCIHLLMNVSKRFTKESSHASALPINF